MLASHLLILFIRRPGRAPGIAALGWFTARHRGLLHLRGGLVATLQAFIFATLTAIYFGGAVQAHH